MGEPQWVQVNLAPLQIKYDRGVTSFRLNDCFWMAFAIGCGFVGGAMSVIGFALTLHSIIHWVASL